MGRKKKREEGGKKNDCKEGRGEIRKKENKKGRKTKVVEVK